MIITTYRILSYASVKYVSTDIEIDMIVEPIVPVNPNAVKDKLREKKKEVFRIELL